MALSRKRDTWLLVGAGVTALVALLIVVTVITFVTKRKKAQSNAPNAEAIAANRRILAKDTEYGGVNVVDGITNNAYISETDLRVSTISRIFSSVL